MQQRNCLNRQASVAAAPEGANGFAVNQRVLYTICFDGTIGVKWALNFTKNGIVLLA